MITRIRFRNFGPFRDEWVELPLANQGLVLIRGVNKISAAADANGVGKSTIGHAISFGYFGEDLRGRRGDALACRFTKGPCEVVIENEDALGVWTIERGRRPAYLRVTGIDGIDTNEDASVIQDKIEQRLGFGVLTFRNAVVFGQQAFERFASAGQDEQMRILDEIQGLDFTAERSATKEWRDQLVSRLRTLEEEQNILANGRAKDKELIERLQVQRDSYERTKKETLSRFERLATVARERINQCQADRTKIKADQARLVTIRQLESNELLAAAAVGDAKRISDDARVALTAATEALKVITDKLARLLTHKECPECLGEVQTQKAAIEKRYEKRIADAKKVVQQKQDALDRADKDLEERAIVHNQARAELAQAVPEEFKFDPSKYILRLEVACGETAERKLRTAIEEATREVNRINADIRAEQAKTWDGAELLATTQQRLALTESKLLEIEQKIVRCKRTINVAEYIYEATSDRGIRSLCVDSVASYINERLVHHLELLACGEVTVRMSAQTALKKGGAKDRISFATEWSWGGSGPEDGSGGQDQRKHLAVFAAVQDLAEVRSARPFPLKLWDEPGDNLDSRGKELFLQWVSAEARARGTGLLITHDEALAGSAEPDQTWTVVLDEKGAHVET